jgi:hypothetical protein
MVIARGRRKAHAVGSVGSNRVEATTVTTYSDLDRAVAVITHSPIVLSDLCSPEPGVRLAGLPDRFDDVDLAILDWITAEGRRIGRSVVRI